MAIRAALIFNNHGKPRMTRFYAQLPTSRQQALIQRTFALVNRRTSQGTTSSGREVCNFLDAPELRPLLATSTAAAAGGGQDRVVYRHYATLYFVFIVDESESELGILDLIQVFVEALDRSFENVCELDLIFHFDEVHAILDEIVQGGLVLETSIAEIAASSHAVAKARKASAGHAMPNPVGSGGTSAAWTPPITGLPWDAVTNVGGWARARLAG